MSLLDKAVDYIAGEKRMISSPIFIKDFNKQNKQIMDLETLSKKLKTGYKKDLIERDITFLKKGLEGENNVYFELKNSFLPILCLHDIRLEFNNYVAQYDFIVISNKFICVLETKKLNGNIVIDSDGNFIRVLHDKAGKNKHEGMYSPITQNERHLSILKEVLLKNNLMSEDLYLSFVVIANPKTIIEKTNCPPEIENKIVRHDQIISSLKYYQEKSFYNKLEKYLFNIAYWLKNNDTPIEINYHSKYNLKENDFIPSLPKNTEYTKEDSGNPYLVNKKSKQQLLVELKNYRLITSRKENLAAYLIFSNEEMERLAEKYPTCEKELLEIKGFGKVKVEKYGKDILKIFTE
ncbi:MAG TPA: aldolase [Desulfotomaculum sp.]|nr:MAG: HRDC domain protein [Desulfotomaculum sp. 46_296]HAG12015.1 aldolase [Desulfotomaculum sp.]HBY04991.1 aldolase [Desulfotomaculum sp.]